MKVICIFIPLLSVEMTRLRLKKQNEKGWRNKAILLSNQKKNFRELYVARRCLLAKQNGVQIGDSLSQALALTKDPQVEAFQAPLERKALLRIAHWAKRFSPFVALDQGVTAAKKTLMQEFQFQDPRSSGLALDVRNSERLFGPDKKLLKNIQRDFNKQFPFYARFVLAPNLASAWAISRYLNQPQVIISDSQLLEILNVLPLSALRLPPSTLNALSELNISRIGQLLSLPRESLSQRFGETLLLRLQQILGEREEPLCSLPAKTQIRREHLFETPISSLEGLRHTSSQLLSSIYQDLERQKQKARQLIYTVKHVGAHASHQKLELSAASLELSHLSSMLTRCIEKTDLGRGIEAIALTASITEKLNFSSIDPFSEKTQASSLKDAGQLIDTLRNRLGRKSVAVAKHQASYFPERELSLSPLENLKTLSEANTQPHYLPRPSLLFSKPELIRVIAAVPDHPPAWLRWRSTNYRVHYGDGPERTAPEWWGRDSSLFKERDYFRVQVDQGLCFWIFHLTANDEWFIHGIWA